MTNRTLQPGDRFGQYKILRLLGRGGMGEVYAVEHTGMMNRRFALKLLNEDLTDSAEAKKRFRDEAGVGSNLEHPNIVRVDDFGQIDGRYYIRMELVGTRGQASGDRSQKEGDTAYLHPSDADGEDGSGGAAVSLGDYLASKGGRLPEAEVREVLEQILEGLAYAHGKGVVHRDLKPANILLSNHGVHGDTEEEGHGAKIADFGLVRLVGEEWLRSQVERSVARSMSLGAEKTVASDSSEGTATRALLGTYAYMSPEQKRGEEADERSDLYAVGLMAFQMVTGQESPGFERPSELVEGIDPAWDGWILSATKADPGQRMASATEMLASLPEVGNGFTTEDTESTERERRSSSYAKASAYAKATADKTADRSAAEAGAGKGRRARTPRKRKSGLGKAALLLLLLAALGYAGWHWGLPQWEAYQERQAEAARQEQALVEASAEQERLRSEVEAALTTGDLAVAGRGIAALEEAGAPVGDLKVRYEALGDAREARSRAGEAEVLRERVLALSRSDGEGLSDNVDGMESAWRAAERAFEDEVWSESLSGYDRVLREGEAVLEAAQEREKARRARSSAENLAGEVAALREQQGSDVENGFADLQKQAVSLGAEAERLYEQSAFAEAAAKWTEEMQVLRQAKARGEALLAYRAKKQEWEEALGEADRKLLEEFGGEKWEEARRLAATAERSESDPVAGQRAYAGAVTALAAAVSTAQEKSEPILEESSGPVAGRNYRLNLGGGEEMQFVWIQSLNAWVGKYEVTNGEFRRFDSGHNSGDYKGHSLNGNRQPVVEVSWDEADDFCDWLSDRQVLEESGIRARLLTGDEWTAIARCGTSREYPWGNSMPPTLGNYGDLTAREKLDFTGIDGYRDGFAVSAPVERSGDNEWGLYGVGGNVWEWTREKSGSSRVLRGASWAYGNPGGLRVESRFFTRHPSNRYYGDGFRVLLVAGG